jgi:hypothetical protein
MTDFGEKVSKRSRFEGLAVPELGLLLVWLVFYGLLVVHGLNTSRAERLAKAWTVEDNAEGVSGGAQALRASLSLSVDRIAH